MGADQRRDQHVRAGRRLRQREKLGELRGRGPMVDRDHLLGNLRHRAVDAADREQ